MHISNISKCERFRGQEAKRDKSLCADLSRRIHSRFTQTLEGSTLRISVHDRFNICREREREKIKWVHYYLRAKNKYVKSPAFIGSVKFRKQIRAQHLRNASLLIRARQLKQRVEYQRQGEQAVEQQLCQPLWENYARLLLFLSSIKNLWDPALSYKEARVSALSWSRADDYDSINQQRTNYANPSTQSVKRSILTAI